MRARDADRLLAAAIPVRSALDALENDDVMPQTYHLNNLVDAAERLRQVVDDLAPQSESADPSGSALPG